MSLHVAHQWAKKYLWYPEAADDVLETLAQASREGVDATVIAGKELAVDNRCRMLRWTGVDLQILELTAAQQAAFQVKPNVLGRYLGIRPLRPNPLPLRLASLSALEFEDGDLLDEQAPLRGRCEFQIDSAVHSIPGNQALQLTYFHPEMRCNVSSFWYPSAPLMSVGKYQFDFLYEPLAKTSRDAGVPGPMAVFMHAVTMIRHDNADLVQRLSNVVGCVVGA